ncbi:UvrD-helicase domain-containing protein (plasmid) [Rhodococcus qingshengii]|uniref:UvrD-helicase domain-containing protein n=1 Tax=Rhodococcus qingshengii TaxID=334542 RepID=UPI0021122CFC|nr:UvrD-helicase domain-containing protein [Rhodococcus qingshengii]UUE28571.1 UvrD-helicase domain-containing protein [Rhodococcus qingshengii]
MNAPYSPETFSKDRVDAAAAILGIELSQQEQWDFIQSATSLDLQAAPGSGKTSLIGLKLALLAQGWTSTTRGVCVLSHTNTAKDEITARLTASPAGAKLLRYPHFIGTIQSFANTFFALPVLRSRGVVVHVIDDAVYAEAAVRLFTRSPDFGTLRFALARRFGNGENLVAGAHFVWEGGELAVKTSEKLPFGLDTASGKEFVELKQRLAWQGVFRYADMFAIAERTLAQNVGLAAAAAHRFPFVLLDEMQDTDDAQQQLLDQVFAGTESVVQRVGDVNQSIFTVKTGKSVARPSAFPRSDALELRVSRRFGPDIAELVSGLTVHRAQVIEGVGPPGRIAVLLYDDDCIAEVVRAFELMASEIVPRVLLLNSPPRVLGSRKDPGTSKKSPKSISCYVPEYSSVKTITGEGSLVRVARSARVRWLSGEANFAVEQLWNGVRGGVRSATPLPSLRRLARDHDLPGGRLRTLLLDILTDPLDCESRWEAMTNQLFLLLVELTDDQNIGVNKEAIAYIPPAIGSLQQHVSPAVPDDGAVTGVVGTIQGAKGETHAATLILECLDRSGNRHDVHEVLSSILDGGGFPATDKTRQRMAELIFVGASRPTHLLTFAVHRTRAEPYMAAASARGWIVRDLTLIPT